MSIQRAELKGALDVLSMRTGMHTIVNLSGTVCSVLIDSVAADVPKSWLSRMCRRLIDTVLINVLGSRHSRTRNISVDPAVTEAPKSWPSRGKLILDGFVYRRIQHPGTPDDRLNWLRLQLPSRESKQRGEFRSQPYRQLAATLRNQGHDAEAKRILIGWPKTAAGGRT
jgi:hypothetical protein